VKVSELSLSDLIERLSHRGLYMRIGPFVFHVQTDVAQIVDGIRLLYRDFPVAQNGVFADFHVRVANSSNIRRWFRPQVRFYFDGESPFRPLPLNQAFAMFEWCTNWCISSHANQYLVIHAAAVERDGSAAILPGPPGSGKSTLAAALVSHGWRLLTDELTLIAPQTNTIVPLPRPIGLKNDSIHVIRDIAPQADFGPECQDTVKGTIAHMRSSTESVLRVDQPALPGWVIFPKFKAHHAAATRRLPKAQTFMWFAASSFNYTVLGMKGFAVLSKLIDATDCYELGYSNLDDAIAWFDSLKPSQLATTAERANAREP
jgi:HprK-related kinase A